VGPAVACMAVKGMHNNTFSSNDFAMISERSFARIGIEMQQAKLETIVENGRNTYIRSYKGLLAMLPLPSARCKTIVSRL
jgi:hypothetical protein